MAPTKKSKLEKKRKNVESKNSRKMKETKKQAAKVKSKSNKVKSKSNKEKENKQLQSNNRKKIANGVAVVPISSSSESGENTSEIEEVAVGNKIKNSNGRTNKVKSRASKGKKRNNEEEEERDRERDSIAFPMNRIRTIVKCQDSELWVSNEAVFAIKKATFTTMNSRSDQEKFLERFTKDAYASCVEDRKKSLAYKHLASVVSKQKKYDFLSDFVPEQVLADDALRERNSAEQIPIKQQVI